MAGVCDGSQRDCTYLDADCRMGACNTNTGTCEIETYNEGDSCEDDDPCYDNDTCDANGNCYVRRGHRSRGRHLRRWMAVHDQ